MSKEYSSLLRTSITRENRTYILVLVGITYNVPKLEKRPHTHKDKAF